MTRPLAALTLALSAAVAAGHETRLLPTAPDAAPGAAVAFDLSSGDKFPTPGNAIKADRVAEARVRHRGEVRDVKELAATPKSLRLTVTPAGAGVLHAWVRLKPRRIELDDEQVKEYFAEIDAPAAIRDAWDKRPAPRQWRELYTKTATTFVRVGTGGGPATEWSTPVGTGLEIVPGADPTALRAGDALPVRVLLNGKPVEGFALGHVRAGGKPDPFARTDRDGRTKIPLPDPGRHLLYGTHLRPHARPDTEWDSDFTTLTLDVRAKAGP